jgi:hypothetical protein
MVLTQVVPRKTKITGLKTADNTWTQTLRDKLDPDTVNVKLAGDRTFKTNQQWVTITHGGNKEVAPKWSWYGVLFMMLVPYGLLLSLPGKYTAAVTTARRRGECGSRSTLVKLRFMLRTRLVAEACVMVVDGICIMLAHKLVEYSHSTSVSEYKKHFCVCNTNCSSFFLFVGKTGNAHTHDVGRRRTNTLPVENRRGIDAPSCVPSGCSLPLSFKTFRSTGSTDSSPLVPGFITPGELKPFLHAGLPQRTLFPLITSHLPVGKFLELSQFIARLWKSKLTPWSLPPPRVHVLLRGLCGGKVRPLWSSSPLHCLLKISFFSSHGRVRTIFFFPALRPHGFYLYAGISSRFIDS